ncbi:MULTISPECIES: pirin family protein [Vibrio]|uniref:pirin family protein n=1 Tax=Vibrio TaxID=662 RepID=UPI00207527C9|nr:MULTISPECIES: pirin family protein [Vibrio]USD34544.1 pirin family protein [Vibrio sp. SCSIO 43186]USD47612.1 pirin family protein [Vibrio sp. SCSIO 43145]USD71669.1 pirin family protein [Vibrio sp. SCSIO 43139]USD98573.1 quercetin 2,3-dioxygenase [Vibrio coralliilyticus]
MSQLREIRQIISAHATSDGDGVKISRVAGFNNANFSPFLMMDELKSDQRSDYIGGFPPHPHRGIETLTYMLKGHFQHKDHMGNVGELRSGGAQWMAAGRGVIHSEMPIMQDGDLHGFQIWINQPARDKMKPAQYHDFQPETVTEYHNDSHGLLRVLAGEVSIDGHLEQGPLNKTGVLLSISDWRSETHHKIKLITPQKFNMMLYVYQGAISVKERKVQQGEMALLSAGEAAELAAMETSGVLIFQGEPIDEPVVHYGPFVMNSMQEIEQAISDYNNGEFEKY